MSIIDFHTHAFPDSLAEKAIPYLEKEGNIKAVLDGKINSLLASMDRAGIQASVVASIATRPEQFRKIFDWSLTIQSERLLPFPSVHPAEPHVLEQIQKIAEAGFKGIKLHPYYQDFYIDESRMFPLYAKIQEYGLILLLHTGFDMAFERIRRADPMRILRVVESFPSLKLVATHFGAWEDWEKVEKFFLGRPIYTDISYAIQFMSYETARRYLLAHPQECILFGTDSPWADQRDMVELVRSLNLGQVRENAIFYENAKRLLSTTQ